jgi:hypothetical protein
LGVRVAASGEAVAVYDLADPKAGSGPGRAVWASSQVPSGQALAVWQRKVGPWSRIEAAALNAAP